MANDTKANLQKHVNNLLEDYINRLTKLLEFDESTELYVSYYLEWLVVKSNSIKDQKNITELSKDYLTTHDVNITMIEDYIKAKYIFENGVFIINRSLIERYLVTMVYKWPLLMECLEVTGEDIQNATGLSRSSAYNYRHGYELNNKNNYETQCNLNYFINILEYCKENKVQSEENLKWLSQLLPSLMPDHEHTQFIQLMESLKYLEPFITKQNISYLAQSLLYITQGVDTSNATPEQKRELRTALSRLQKLRKEPLFMEPGFNDED